MPTILITGANRGLGLEFARQYLAEGWRVIATCRHPEKAKSLKALQREKMTIIPCDVSNIDAIAALAQTIRNEPVDLLLNNAGVSGSEGRVLGHIDSRAFMSTLFVNSLAPLLLTQALLPHLEYGQGKTIIAISSQLGSITRNQKGGLYAYRASKAALNAVVKSLAIDLEPRGITIAALHPGWVKTDMGGQEADLTVETSVSDLRQVIARLTPAQSGHFFNHDGTEIPW